jgi:hypothetical protein
MNRNAAFAILAAFVFLLGPSRAPAATDGETIYAVDIPGNRRLVVVKAEIPKETAREDSQGKLLPPEPGAQYPDHVYEYSFIVRPADGASEQVVGRTRMGTFSGEVERMQFTIFDAFVFDDQLVVLYRSKRATCGDIAQLGPRGTGFLMALSRPLEVDARESGSWVIGGRLEGDPKAGDLRAIVTEYFRGQTVDKRFLLVNQNGQYKWTLEPAKPPK